MPSVQSQLSAAFRGSTHPNVQKEYKATEILCVRAKRGILYHAMCQNYYTYILSPPSSKVFISQYDTHHPPHPQFFLSSGYPNFSPYSSSSLSVSPIFFSFFPSNGSLSFPTEFNVDFLRFYISRGPVKRQKQEQKDLKGLTRNKVGN